MLPRAYGLKALTQARITSNQIEAARRALTRAAGKSAKVWVRYQSEIWPRPLDRFRATFRTATDVSGHAEPFVQVVNGLAEPVHISILLDTFATFLPAVLAGRETAVPVASP